MYKLSIKIQSFTDLITNSSSEAYMYLSFGAVSDFVDILDSMLHLAGYEGSCTDYFEFEKDFDRITITAKDPRNDDVARTLSLVNSLFYVSD